MKLQFFKLTSKNFFLTLILIFFLLVPWKLMIKEHYHNVYPVIIFIFFMTNGISQYIIFRILQKSFKKLAAAYLVSHTLKFILLLTGFALYLPKMEDEKVGYGLVFITGYILYTILEMHHFYYLLKKTKV